LKRSASKQSLWESPGNLKKSRKKPLKEPCP
jgi:hypothetical protein